MCTAEPYKGESLETTKYSFPHLQGILLQGADLYNMTQGRNVLFLSHSFVSFTYTRVILKCKK